MTRKQAKLLDDKIFFLANYYESEGLTKTVKAPKYVMRRFTEFKKRIQMGCFTYKWLENNILDKFSAESEVKKMYEKVNKLFEDESFKPDLSTNVNLQKDLPNEKK